VVDWVRTVRVDEAFSPTLSLTLDGVTETAGAPVPFGADMVAVSEIVPANPPILTRVRFEESAEPASMTSRFGIGIIAKSRAWGSEVGEAAWVLGRLAVVAPIVRIRRTRLEAAREYFEGGKMLTTVPLHR
jgi:hypothetical protein